MIIEFHDIANNKTAFGHAQGLPEGANLGMLFEKRPGIKPDLSQVKELIVRVSINGRRTDNWEEIRPGEHDRVCFTVVPGVIDWVIVGAVAAVISAVVAVVQLILALTASPPDMDSGGRKQSDTYAFDGIKDTFQLGSPVGVTYGGHRKGGQVLMYYLTMMPENKGTQVHMLLSMGEGPVESISDIELNDLPLTELESVTSVVRLGTSSQAVIPGFETIRNTFYDGREITDSQKNGTHQHTTSHLIHRTIGYDVRQCELFICARQGMYKARTTGGFDRQWSEYRIEHRSSDLSSYDETDAPWTTYETRRISGRGQVPVWDFVPITFPRPNQWDLRVTWLRARYMRKRHMGREQHKIWLMDITEIRGASGPFSNECLLAIQASPTAQMNGGQPNATAIVKGRTVDVYRTVNSFQNEWTDNPAWPMVDWMTNSRYGMGADIPIEDVDIQSFLDFATLAESLAENCVGSAQSTGCEYSGTDEFFAGTRFQFSSIDPIWFNPEFTIAPFELRSKWAGVAQNGIAYCKICCPPDQGFGVNSGEFLNSWQDAQISLRSEITSGNPVFGVLIYVRSGSTANQGTAYGWIVNAASKTLALCRWNGSAMNTYGTVLQTYSWNPQSGDYFYLQADDPLYNGNPNNNVDINVYAEGQGGANVLDEDVTDSSASRILYSVLDRYPGAIALPTNLDGNYHEARLGFPFGETGLCYSPILQTGTHDLTCVQAIPYYAVL